MTAPSQSDTDYAARARDVLGFSRWWQVAAAAVMMGLISPYQYVWSSIESPIARSLGLDPTALGFVFTLFVVFQAGSQFPVGWYRDRHGPRELTLLAGVLAGGGYLGLAYATELWQLYVLYSLGAVGVGIVYTVAVNTALKWFPDRRGLTTGLGTMAFAGGSALFVPYVRANATVGGYPDVLRNMGLLIGVGILVGALVLRDPPTGWAGTVDGATDDAVAEGDDATATGRQYTSREMVRTWQFWLMYVMFVCVSGAGLMLTAKVVSFAQNVGLTALTATAGATVLPIAGGVGRLVVGDLSDRVDRERAMAVSFTLCGLGLFAVVWSGAVDSSLGFLAAVVLATFFWSPQYTLFPSVVGDYYGQRHSSANYALLYSGKMWGGVFGGGVAGWLVTRTGWSTAFALGGGLAVLAGIGALVLREPSA
ncbi:OFA family MFS transporter [Halorussus sp. AFM4]|uniref:OFA family MFS transporter n=1 Tax=Halorussus sp. AFM4 TaxID=3421651 RepID=UPI003EBE9519